MQHDFILLDRSGSMSDNNLWGEALAAVNLYVKKLADDNVDTGVTLAIFDTDAQGHLDFQVIRDRITPKTWRPVTNNDASPRNMTPLSDATARIVALANAGNYEKVAIIIMTDGQENSSKEYSVTQAKVLLDSCRAKNWQVIFLGANFDNAMQASSYGNAPGATAAVASGNLGVATRTTARMRGAYGATGDAMNFTDEDKKSLASKPGDKIGSDGIGNNSSR